MKVIIQIPCLNEENSLPITLQALPRTLQGIDEVEWLIIDDGSHDETINVAIANGIDYVIKHPDNRGLAAAFENGVQAAIMLGADIIVNTDADNQYCAEDIQKLVDPIVRGEAEYVIGTRPIQDTEHFSPIKKKLQHLGSNVVRFFSQTTVEDAPSGFRAISKDAAMRLHVFNKYTYTLETIIQAGQSGISITTVPIRTNDELRPSRLMSSIRSYIKRSVVMILRSFMTYRPLLFFLVPASILLGLGILLGVRFLYFFFILNEKTGHIQSLILAVILFVVGSSMMISGFLADLIAVNRMLLERVDLRIKRLESGLLSTEDAVPYLVYRKNS